MGINYYNEFDAKAVKWLRELISAGLIPEGDVDERSIAEIQPGDLRGYDQCHFFAGVGGWSLALQIAGIPSTTRLWTGSCPCQAFSSAGKQKGFADKRDLWPVFANLIRECRPPVVFGEQVESAVRFGWLDRVYGDLEAEGYTCGSAVLGAHSVQAPHQRQRLYWAGTLGDSYSQRLHRKPISIREELGENIEATRAGDASSLGDTASIRSKWNGESGQQSRMPAEGYTGDGNGSDESRRFNTDETGSTIEGCQSRNHWSDSIAILCKDGKYRRIPASAQSVLLQLVNGLPTGMAGCDPRDGFPLAEKVKNRTVMLKGLGNAIVPQVAAEFIKAFGM